MVNDSYWVLEGSRDRILDILDGTCGLSSLRQEYGKLNYLAENSYNILKFVWIQKPTEVLQLPQIIVGASEALDDLISWSSTYLRAIGPLSSHVRLLEASDIWSLADRRQDEYSQLYKAMVGLIIGEVSYLAGKIIPPEEVTVAACQSTLSFALAKGILANIAPEQIARLPNAWIRAREITDQKQTGSDVGSIISAFRILSGVSDDYLQTPQQQALRSLQSGDFGDFSIFNLFSELSVFSIDQLNSYNKLSAEDKLHIYDHFSALISRSFHIDSNNKGFYIALLAVLCRPGAYEAIRLLNSRIKEVPSCALWYGIMQGVIPKNDTLSSGEGLGWRVLRDLTLIENILDRPRCDVSLRELEIYSRSHGGLRPIKTENKSRLLIELFPGITSSFKSNERTKGTIEIIYPAVLDQESLFNHEYNQQRFLETRNKLVHDLEKKIMASVSNVIKEALLDNTDDNPSKVERPKKKKSSIKSK